MTPCGTVWYRVVSDSPLSVPSQSLSWGSHAGSMNVHIMYDIMAHGLSKVRLKAVVGGRHKWAEDQPGTVAASGQRCC
jgi:hypothetical protein